jgi:enterochelin esterase family protein
MHRLAILAFLTAPLLLMSSLSAQQPEKKKVDWNAEYMYGPDSMEQDVPHGTLEKFRWTNSKIFPGTERDWGLYIPKQYDGKTPIAFMVFQDGLGYMNPKGAYRVPVVFDNLIAKKEIPVMAAVFVNPGIFTGKDPKKGGSNRSFEYDTLSADYVTFLEKEILPEAEKKVKLSSDPKMRGIGGASSGGICAFTAAWERPDLFTKVLSHIGSFTNIRGGDVYPGKIRKTPNKPLRVFLQDGDHDLDNEHGNWPLANLQMEKALQFKHYDVKTAWGHGDHNGRHGGTILPESMRWLWRDEK